MADDLAVSMARLQTLLEGLSSDVKSIKDTIAPWPERLATLEQKVEDSRRTSEASFSDVKKTLNELSEWRQSAEPKVASLSTGIKVVATLFLTTVGVLGGAVGWLLKTVSENDRMGRVHEVQIKALEQKMESRK